MFMIYEPDKKDKNALDSLKLDMITIKIILYLVSLAKNQNSTRHVLNVCLGADGILGAVEQSCPSP